MKSLFKPLHVNLGLVLLWSVCFMSCQNRAGNETETEDPNLITCERIGPVLKNSTASSLEETFGSENLSQSTRNVDGEERNITRVFANQPEEVTILWSKEDPNVVEKLIVMDENGPYHTKENLRVGISLRDVVRINNFLPVTFSNFYSGVGGYGQILSFGGGEIEKNYPCLKGQLDIVRLNGIDVNALETFKELDTVQSNHQLVQNMLIKITEITLE